MAEKISVGVSSFLAYWWCPGAFVLIFQGPFKDGGESLNGYFGTLFSFFFAIHWFGVSAIAHHQLIEFPGETYTPGDYTPAPGRCHVTVWIFKSCLEGDWPWFSHTYSKNNSKTESALRKMMFYFNFISVLLQRHLPFRFLRTASVLSVMNEYQL